MSALADAIFELVATRGGVTFAELGRLAGFADGDKELLIEDARASNIVIWSGLTDAGIDALRELQLAGRIHWKPTSYLTYLWDGKLLRLPLAKAARHYKEPHWLPVVFDVGPGRKQRREQQQRGKEKEKPPVRGFP